MNPHTLYRDFLRYSINETQPVPDLKDMDWNRLYEFAKKQSLVGILYQGIQRLPQGTFTDIDLLAKWTFVAQRIRGKNNLVTSVADKVSRIFAKNGFCTCILKGQGNALMYPDPGLRTPGDVDIYVDGDDEKVIKFCRQHFGGGRPIYHHIDVKSVDGVNVEVHYRPSFLNQPIHNARLQRWFKQNADLQCSNVKHVAADGKQYSFAVPTGHFNLVYQLMHVARHFLHKGIGLRQIIDYYMLLRRMEIDEPERQILERELKSFGVYGFARAMMWVLEELFALPREKMYATPNESFGRALLEEILQGGNFGQHAQMASWKRDTQIGRNIQRLERDLRLCWYYPSEALWEPLFRLYHYFWRLRHK